MDNIRAYRRTRRAAMKAKARKLYPDSGEPGRYADHLAKCSCWMCGNPRRYKMGVTLAEHRAQMRDQAAINDALDTNVSD